MRLAHLVVAATLTISICAAKNQKQNWVTGTVLDAALLKTLVLEGTDTARALTVRDDQLVLKGKEFVYVIEGEPDVWLDGHLHRLKPGDAVGFPAGTGIAHSFLNNTEAEVHLLVVGERSKAENRIVYPLNPDRKPLRRDWWDDHPRHTLGPHDGLPDQVRRKGGASRKSLPLTEDKTHEQ